MRFSACIAVIQQRIARKKFIYLTISRLSLRTAGQKKRSMYHD